ncbi:hypothetical protein CAEBREN_28288 [Caenorhabditis brenneri]|uniref:Uncharacterized protein n=1 Tax=Caenorhabditis brenneri TaxID=135651 RepID=G0NQR3_CAEBE|nr:hypothetical protein CAEBREN_28288 [Caenorhabditis brenneri]
MQTSMNYAPLRNIKDLFEKESDNVWNQIRDDMFQKTQMETVLEFFEMNKKGRGLAAVGRGYVRPWVLTALVIMQKQRFFY